MNAASIAQKNTRVRSVRKSPETVRRSQMLYRVMLVGLFVLLIVFMSAFAADLRRVNNELQISNGYLQAEIDSLENQIGDAASINRIESIATKELGMVHPDSENCIALGSDKNTDTNLAATIKDEAYD